MKYSKVLSIVATIAVLSVLVNCASFDGTRQPVAALIILGDIPVVQETYFDESDD